MEIAQTIINQMGGSGRLYAMVGAYNYLMSSKDPTWVSFRFKGSKKVNYMKVKLNGFDLYDVEFGRVWGSKYTVVEECKDLYNDMLKPVFEDLTGLYLSL